VAGVILTGALDDGTAGLRDIKQRGGIAVVQDPREALYYGMPYSAIEHVAVDYVLPLNDIGPVLAQLATEAPQPAERYPVAQRLEVESQMADREDAEMSDVEKIGIRSAFTCPECHGALWEVKDDELLRFRCHVGHSFSSESLEVEQVEGIEQALWSALRALEEKAELARRILNRLRERQLERAAALQEQKAYEAEQHASTIRAMLLGSPTADSVVDT
jgi:two-component system chemotaxis response regulator CheB